MNVWSLGERILTGKNESTNRHICPSATLSAMNPTRLTCDQTLASSVRDRWLTAYAMAPCVCVCVCVCMHMHVIQLSQNPLTLPQFHFIYLHGICPRHYFHLQETHLCILSPSFLSYRIAPNSWLHMYLFIVYLTTSSVAHTIQDQMVANHIGKNDEGSSCGIIPSVCLKGLRKTTKTSHCQSPGSDCGPRSPKHEVGVLSNGPGCSIF
jgi:hypothetical protein